MHKNQDQPWQEVEQVLFSTIDLACMLPAAFD